MPRLVWALVREMGRPIPKWCSAENMSRRGGNHFGEETRFARRWNAVYDLDEKSSFAQKGRQFERLPRSRLYDTTGFSSILPKTRLRKTPADIRRHVAYFTDAEGSAGAKRGARTGRGKRRYAEGTLWFPLRENLGATEFLGLETESARTRGRSHG